MIESENPVGGPYVGNSSATTFAYEIPILDKTEIIVTKTVIATGAESTLIVDTDYTVNGVGSDDDADWDITYPVSGSPMTSTERIVITPNIPILQETNFSNNGGFLPENHTASFDRLTVICQQLQAVLDRCVQVTVGSTTDPADLISDLEDAAADADTAATSAASSASSASTSATAAASSATSASSSATAAAASAASASNIAAGVVTTKGDLITRTSSTVVRQAVGANDTALFADSAQTNGIKYATIDLSTTRVTGTNPVTKGGTGLAALGTALQQLRVNSGATALEYFTPSSLGDLVIIQDQRTNGTVAGAATAGSFQTRVLNTEVVDTGNNATLASNQITLLAGTYRVRAIAQFNGVQYGKIRLRNITDTATLVVGHSFFAGSATSFSDPGILEGRFTIAATKVIELQYFVGFNSSTNDLGPAATSGEVEVTATVVLQKE